MEERDIYAAGITVSGIVLVILQLLQGIQQLEGFAGSDLIIVFVFETLPFVIVAVALTAVGYWLYRHSRIEAEMERVALWGAGSVIIFVSVAALLVFSLQVTLAGDTLSQAQYIVVNLLTVGGFSGVLVGIYDARSRMRRRQLEAERDRVEQFANKAADINNYGRELNKCESVEEVSSLCLQAMQAFLGLTNLAFVVTADEEFTFVDDTTVGTSREALVTLVRESLDQPKATVVTQEPSGGEIDRAITMLVTTTDGSSIVLLAVTDGDEEIGDEDVQLLEMLVSHAATALDGLSEERTRSEESSAT